MAYSFLKLIVVVLLLISIAQAEPLVKTHKTEKRSLGFLSGIGNSGLGIGFGTYYGNGYNYGGYNGYSGNYGSYPNYGGYYPVSSGYYPTQTYYPSSSLYYPSYYGNQYSNYNRQQYQNNYYTGGYSAGLGFFG